jgi:DnaD/phage-associated family protein
MHKDAYYFPHDSNARHDEKCAYIISKYGPEGYGLYWMFTECMHENYDGKLTCKLLEGFSFTFHVDKELLKKFYNDAIEIGLFVTDGNKYWSERVLRNKADFDEKRGKKSNAGKLGMQTRWALNNSVITENNSVITKHNKGKESKVKESKVKERKGKERKVEESKEVLHPAAESPSNPFCTYSNNIGLITEHISERIKALLDDGVTDELLSRYIEIACERNKRTWAYIEKMALGNLENNIRTVQDYEAMCVERRNQRQDEESSNVFHEIGKDRGLW